MCGIKRTAGSPSCTIIMRRGGTKQLGPMRYRQYMKIQAVHEDNHMTPPPCSEASLSHLECEDRRQGFAQATQADPLPGRHGHRLEARAPTALTLDVRTAARALAAAGASAAGTRATACTSTLQTHSHSAGEGGGGERGSVRQHRQGHARKRMHQRKGRAGRRGVRLDFTG